MSYYAVNLSLTGPLAAAVAVEWTNLPQPVASGQGWEPCLRQPDGTWRFASHDPLAGLHRRAPGRFGDLAIRYRLEPAGPWSASPLSRKEIVVLKVEGEGEADLLAAPGMLAMPSLAGAGVIGTELALDPGTWSGFPAPTLAFQWRRDGAAIPGASARAYALVPADDGRGLDCLVSAASPAGRAEAATPAVGARYAAPTRRADLPEEVFDEAKGPELVETAPAFAGENLSFSAEGSATGLSIDARTGVLSLPVDTPVSGGVVTITARNSGGAATAVLRYTVEGAPGRRLGAADVTVLRSLWRPVGQATTFSPEIAFPGLAGETVQAIEFTNDPAGAAAPVWHPVRAKAGAAGVWQLFDRNDPVAAGRADAALWGPGTPRTGRLRFRWRVSQLHPWSDAGATLAVPAPTVDRALFAMTRAEAEDALPIGLVTFKVASTFSGSGEGVPCNNVRAQHGPAMVALEAFSEQGRTFTSDNWSGAQAGSQRLLAQLRHWANDAQTAPAGRSGYSAQYEMQFVSAVAVARLVPAVWNALSQTERARLDLVMKGCLVSNCFILSDNSPYPGDWNSRRTLRGYACGRGNAPNFSTPVRLTPYVVAQYMKQNGEDAQAFLNGFDQAAFAAQAAALGGLDDLWRTFRRRWTSAVQAEEHQGTGTPIGEGPTAAQVLAAISGNGGGVFRGLGLTLAQPLEMFQLEINRLFDQEIVPGPAGYAGGEAGPGWTTKHGVRVASTKNVLRGCLGSALGSGETDKAAWAALPNRGLIGMAKELNTKDGGEGGGPAMRSSMSYALNGSMVGLVATVVMACYDALPRTPATWAEPRARMSRGITDLRYRTVHGHRSYAKGGGSSSNNEDWNEGYTTRHGYRLASFWGLHRVLEGWFAA